MLNENPEARIDSEYVLKQYLEYDALISNQPFKKINDIAFVTDGIHSSIDFDEDSNINLISAKAPKKNVFNLSGTGYISYEQNRLNPRTQLKENDIIISTVGTIGNCAVVDESILPANSDRHVGIVRLENTDYKPRYISTFLLSKYGRFQTKRHTTGNVQPNLFIYKIKELKIPYISESFQQKIEDMVVEANALLLESKEAYDTIEKIFMKNVSFDSYVEPKEVCSIKSFSEAFGKSGRLDAEYYQEKFDVLFERLDKYNTKRLIDIVNISKSIEPGSDYYTDEGIPFIRVSDLSKYGVSEPAIHLLKGTDNLLGIPYPKKDTILLSKDGSVGIAYKLEKDADFVTSGALLHLTLKKDADVLPDYLTLVLNSKIVQMQAERDAGGSIIQHWKPSEIENVVIPIIDMKMQEKIAQQIQLSFSLRTQADKMLSDAVRAVEIAVESGGKAALNFLVDI